MEEPIPPEQPLCGMREYGRLEVIIANIPYVVMTILGAAIFAGGWDGPVWNWVPAGAYLLYAVFGMFLIVLFVCPFCAHHGTNGCPCGYGKIAAKVRKKQEIECFDKKFKTYIPMIVPLWFLPLIAGGYIVVHQFSWWYSTLLVVFAIDAFVILPLVSTQHGCKECPQRDTCPWMKQKPLGS
jgi:hypothetical protein